MASSPGLHVPVDVLVRLIGGFIPCRRRMAFTYSTVFVSSTTFGASSHQRLQERIDMAESARGLKALHDEKRPEARGNIRTCRSNRNSTREKEVRLREVDILDTAGPAGGEIVAQPLRIHADWSLQRIHAGAGLLLIFRPPIGAAVCVDGNPERGQGFQCSIAGQKKRVE